MRLITISLCSVALGCVFFVTGCGDGDTDTDTVQEVSPPGCNDTDGDGQLGWTVDCLTGRDCDDTDDEIFDGAVEICDGEIDENCDGVVDEGCPDCVDTDNDGYYAVSLTCAEGLDCNDMDGDVNPAAAEIPDDGIDNNCDGTMEETSCVPDCEDRVCGDDGCGDSCGDCVGGWTCFDGACEEGLQQGKSCLGKCGETYDPNADCQCDQNCQKVGDCCDDFCDSCPALGTQICECVPDCVDKECGGDGCGGTCGACGEGSACDSHGTCGCTDEATTACGPDANVYWYDSCGNQGVLKATCGADGCVNGACAGCTANCDGVQCGDDGCGGECGTCEGGSACVAGQCEVPTLPGSCEGRCGDYDGSAECQCDSGCFSFGDCCEDVCTACESDYAEQCGCKDLDGDGFGEGPSCAGPDCDDSDAAVNPDGTEVPGNGKDDDCVDGDEELEPVECVEELDGDGDGYCPPVDCDDDNADINPSAEDVCEDGINQDCSDDGDAVCPEIDCVDEDGDGYGVGAECDGSDCNDQDPSINTSAEAKEAEVCGDGIDQDCDGADPDCPETCKDDDGDGHYGFAEDCTEGTDCDDDDASTNPDAEDICDDEINQDCSEDGLDAVCETGDSCSEDSDCPSGSACNLSGGAGFCEAHKYWDWWAPVVYLDTHSDDSKLGWDFFTDVEFDGDEIAGNNGDHVNDYDKPALAYYSYAKTDTHAYIGYHYYFPWRWSDATFGGTKYENVMRGVLLVIRLDEGNSMGTLELMETTTENSIYRYVPEGSEVEGGLIDGTVYFDNEGDHARPIVNIWAESHNIKNGQGWDTDGFPGGNGWLMRWGWKPGTPKVKTGSATYALQELKSTLWAKRNQIGPVSELFDAFGRFAGDDADGTKSVTPWRYNDQQLAASKPWGEMLYDPASLVRRHFSAGWGEFSYEYSYNPYVLRVQVNDLWVYDDGSLFEAAPDVYINLYLRDGKGTQQKVLGEKEGDGLQNFWKFDNMEIPKLVFMSGEMGRNYFYGIDHPDHEDFGIEVRDADFGIDGWLMDPSERYYGSFEGTKLVDFELSDSFMAITYGEN
jgi:hypothetical protein